MELTAVTWNSLMDRVVAEVEKGDFIPGQGSVPGSGSEGDDPLGLKYIDLGPLAYVVNEAIDSAVTRGLDRDSLVTEVVQAAGEGISADDVEAIISGDDREPTVQMLEALATALDIDYSILLDAAQRGGAKNLGTPSTPPD